MTISARGRAKRVTDPLDDKVKARLRGDDELRRGSGYFSSSGSEHDAEASDFVDGFFFSEKEGSDDVEEAEEESVERSAGFSDGEGLQSVFAVPAVEMIRDLVNRGRSLATEERYRRDLAVDVARAADRFADLKQNRSAFHRAVMASLRETGYNAGICKSRWESGSGGIVAGSYEYIDVLISPPDQATRYIVDLDFAGEFEIARPTAEYGRLTEELPRLLVARPEVLRQLLRVLADAARRSLRTREMHIPPWRKARFMQAKWLGPYRRTLNPSPSPSSPSSPSPPAAETPPQPIVRSRGDVHCRFLGFDTAAVVFPAAAGRTR